MSVQADTKATKPTGKLAELLRMEHIEAIGATDIADTMQSEREEAEAAPDPRDNEIYTFALNWKDRRGKMWAGTFQNKILSFAERATASAIAARLLGGQRLESIDRETADLSACIGHMTLSLTQRPDWAKDFSQLRDVALIITVWKEVNGHEAHYFRLDTASAEGSGEG